MICLASGEVSDELLKTLWMQRLPKQTQEILSVSSESLNNLAAMADKISETPESWDVSAISSRKSTESTQIQDLKAKIEEITMMIEALANQLRRRSKSRGRSQSKSHYKYHYKFGDRATKCVQPCSFVPNCFPEN
ncbi:uncharacterized protein LOC131996803 [Stomoxys calcitrans]|uniref:uncharacterized protein LOC131996803 n=1 Tax=Stomoxys calcitrans TaxID=35570 RepID=UPI0027E335DA|nr:uncharacterized protein LOC131996803 [Stomoxys calcitrans]